MALFSVTFILSATWIVTSIYFIKAMGSNHGIAKNSYHFAKTAYQKTKKDAELIYHYYPRYAEIYHQGVYGDERRLDWIEALNKARTMLKVPALKYEISERTAYEGKFPFNHDHSLRIYATAMSLDMQMIHEVDLVRLLEYLNLSRLGVHDVSTCQIARRGNGKLAAECTLHWYSLKHHDGSNPRL